MALRIEWRSKSEGHDALLEIDEGTGMITQVWQVEPVILADYLNSMNCFATPSQKVVVDRHPNPPDWGELAMSRSNTGDVISVDPQLYWAGVAYWFRSRGIDPHPWRSGREP